MSETPKSDDGGEAGCFLIVGAIIVGIAFGNIFSSAVGWLVIGLSFILLALADISSRAKRNKS